MSLIQLDIILVPRGRAPFGQHQESRHLGRVPRHYAHAQSKSEKSNWLRMRNEFSAHVQKIGLSQSVDSWC